MYKVICKQCGASGITDNGDRPQGAVSCPCCPVAHDHDATANACPGAGLASGQQHPGEACPHPDGPAACNAIHQRPHVTDDCPGGHCWPGIDDCTACRPLTLEWISIRPLSPVAI